MDFPDDQQYEPQLADDFAQAALPESQGFAGKTYLIFSEILGGTIEHHDQRPLPSLTAWTHAEMTDLHAALAVVSPDAFMYASARYRHLGLALITVGVQVGVSLAGRDRYEAQHPDASGFIQYACEAAPNALLALMGPGRRLMQSLADEALAEVLAVVQSRERHRA